MPGKNKNSLMWGQDLPYKPNDQKVQDYEKQKKDSIAKLRAMNNPPSQAASFAHGRAVAHNKAFFNWGLAKRLYGGRK